MEQFKKMLVEAIESSNEEFVSPFTSIFRTRYYLYDGLQASTSGYARGFYRRLRKIS
jgi:hypothetical protein